MEDIDFSKFKYCECNCGELIPILDKRGRPRRFKQFHGNKGENNGMYDIGKNHPNYKNGMRKCHGYIEVKNTCHPNCHANGEVYQHRLIYEHYLSILFDEEVFIPQKYEIHHINGIKNDNALINLALLTSKQHRTQHYKKDMSRRFCLLCGGKTYTNKMGYQIWLACQDGFICNKCYMKKIRC